MPSHKWPKIVRDPIHNVIEFHDTDCDRLLLDLINCREFQRLRRIKQLGMSELVFPGSNHSRFAHSIGVLVNARRFLDRLEVLGRTADPAERILVLSAALLHDLGHGPYSHAFERVTKDKHEKRTLEIIQTPGTEIHDTLVKHDADLPRNLARFFDEDWVDSRAELPLPRIYTEVVTSQMDADRFDYLMRDSYCTGTGYGRFDLEWLLTHLYVDETGKGPRFYLSEKALLAAEQYVFARYSMYRNVYFHKATRAAEVMLRLAFKRYREVLGSSRAGLAGLDDQLPEAPSILREAFLGSELGLENYLQLDDLTAGEFFKACARCGDRVLQALGRGLVERRLFKAMDVTDFIQKKPDAYAEFVHRSKSFLEAKALDPE
jgi:HD superfamily phosphohydrolase